MYRNAIIRSKSERKNFIADEWDECRDFGGLTFKIPFEKVSGHAWIMFKRSFRAVQLDQGRGGLEAGSSYIGP